MRNVDKRWFFHGLYDRCWQKNATNQRMLANVIRKVKKGSVSVNQSWLEKLEKSWWENIEDLGQKRRAKLKENEENDDLRLENGERNWIMN